jgi:hypothetical protein
MTKKIFIAAGSVALVIAGYLSTSANKKFAGTRTAFFRTGVSPTSVVQTLFKATTSVTHLTTIKANGNGTAFFATVGGNKTLFAVKTAGGGLIKTLFYKH